MTSETPETTYQVARKIARGETMRIATNEHLHAMDGMITDMTILLDQAAGALEYAKSGSQLYMRHVAESCRAAVKAARG